MSYPFPWDPEAGNDPDAKGHSSDSEIDEGPVGPSTEKELKLAAQQETWLDVAKAISRLTEILEITETLERDGKGFNNAWTSETIKQVIQEVNDGTLPVNSGPLAVLLHEPIDLEKGGCLESEYSKVPSSIESCKNGSAATSLAMLWMPTTKGVKEGLAKIAPGSFTSTIQAASSSIGRRLQAASSKSDGSLRSMLLEVMTSGGPIPESGISDDEDKIDTGSINSNVFDWPEIDGSGTQSGHEAWK